MAFDPWSYAAKTRNEYAEQVALFMWAAVAQRYGEYIANLPGSYELAGFAQAESEKRKALDRACVPIPELEWLHAIKNQGHGDAVRGAMSKAEGVKAGVPDLFLPVQRQVRVDNLAYLYGGLYIELKRLKSARGAAGKASEVQTKWHNYLRSAGYQVEICEGWELARDAILRYLGRL